MAVTMDEDWSIISSSDLEDDTGVSRSMSSLSDENAEQSPQGAEPEVDSGRSTESKSELTKDPSREDCKHYSPSASRSVSQSSNANGRSIVNQVSAAGKNCRLSRVIHQADTRLRQQSTRLFDRIHECVSASEDTEPARFHQRVVHSVTRHLESHKEYLLHYAMALAAAGVSAVVAMCVMQMHISEQVAIASNTSNIASSEPKHEILGTQDWVESLSLAQKKVHDKVSEWITEALYEPQQTSKPGVVARFFYHPPEKQFKYSKHWTSFVKRCSEQWMDAKECWKRSQAGRNLDLLQERAVSFYTKLSPRVFEHYHSLATHLRSQFVPVCNKAESVVKKLPEQIPGWWTLSQGVLKRQHETLAAKLSDGVSAAQASLHALIASSSATIARYQSGVSDLREKQQLRQALGASITDGASALHRKIQWTALHSYRITQRLVSKVFDDHSAQVQS